MKKIVYLQHKKLVYMTKDEYAIKTSDIIDFIRRVEGPIFEIEESVKNMDSGVIGRHLVEIRRMCNVYLTKLQFIVDEQKKVTRDEK